jgi:hypothetical protein
MEVKCGFLYFENRLDLFSGVYNNFIFAIGGDFVMAPRIAAPCVAM